MEHKRNPQSAQASGYTHAVMVIVLIGYHVLHKKCAKWQNVHIDR